MYLYSIFPKVELSDCRVARKPLADVLFWEGGGGVDGRVSESAPSSVISLALCEESAMSKNQGPFCNSERQSIVFEMPYVSETQLSVCFERL